MKSIMLFSFMLGMAITFSLLGCKSSGELANKTLGQQVVQDPDYVPENLAVEQQPVPVYKVNPEYPEDARRDKVEGTVWVKAVVRKDGTVKKVVILKSDNEVLNDPAIQAMLQWKFKPAVMDGQPVAVWVAIPFKFKLNQQDAAISGTKQTITNIQVGT